MSAIRGSYVRGNVQRGSNAKYSVCRTYARGSLRLIHPIIGKRVSPQNTTVPKSVYFSEHQKKSCILSRHICLHTRYDANYVVVVSLNVFVGHTWHSMLPSVTCCYKLCSLSLGSTCWVCTLISSTPADISQSIIAISTAPASFLCGSACNISHDYNRRYGKHFKPAMKLPSHRY